MGFRIAAIARGADRRELAVKAINVDVGAKLAMLVTHYAEPPEKRGY